MISKQIGKLFKREGKKGRQRGKKEEKRRKGGEKIMNKKKRCGRQKKGNGKPKKIILPLLFWKAFSNWAWEGKAFKIYGTIYTFLGPKPL